MKTYQDLQNVGESLEEKGAFGVLAIEEFMKSKSYREAKDGQAYYDKHNTTIEKYQKFLYTISGRQVPDIFSTNYKLKTLFFRRLVTQQVQYVCGNGVTLQEEGNKEKLGKDFDFKLAQAGKRAMAGGVAFGFWNFDHLEVFGYADTPTSAGFCPLYDEDTSILEAGIRYWYKEVGDKVNLRFTLYEADGYTDYLQRDGEEVRPISEKKAYKQKITSTLAEGVIDVEGENYSRLPIVPLYANDTHESELVGIRESIDCYDFIKSGLANDIDDTSGFYWVLKNTGGMEDKDLAQFIQRMKTVKATTLDGDEGVEAEAHTLDIPVNARQTMLELLRKDIYEDFQALDVNTLSASAKTTQEIQASYQAQDNKCADFEYFVLDFVQQILELAEINDNPTFTWNRVVNQAEQTQMVLQASQYLTDDAVLKHLPFLTPEEVEDILEQRDEEDYDQFDDDEEEMDEDLELEDEDDGEIDAELDALLAELEE